MSSFFRRIFARHSMMFYAKLFVFIFLLCFTFVNLAAIRRKHINLESKDVHKLNSGEKAKGVAEFHVDSNLKVDSDAHRTNTKLAARADDVKDTNLKFDLKLQDERAAPAKAPEGAHAAGGHKDEDKPAEKAGKKVVNKEDQIEKPDDKENAGEHPLKDDQLPKPEVPHGHDKVNKENKDEAEKKDDDDGEEDEDEEDDEDDDHHHPKPLKLEDLKPPDHLDAVKLEQDGHLNRDFKKEIFIGNHEEFEQSSQVEAEEKLKDIFRKVDTDHNDFIVKEELEGWIVLKVQEHFDEAVEEADRIFKHLDADNDKYVTWKEFHLHFLLAKGHKLSVAAKQVEDYDAIPLHPDDKEHLIRYKFRWAEADDPQDNKLSFEEFRSFRHPEQSPSMLSKMVQDIIDNLDRSNDGKVSEEEFIALPPGDVDESFVETDKAWQEERRTEFRKVIDLDHDGIVTRDELKNYVDPQNPNHARLEAENLIQLADDDKDGKLSLEEILNNAELFLGSKMVDTGKNFHDEF